MTAFAEMALGRICYMLDDPADRYAGKLLWHHCGDSRHCQGSPGLPDLIIAGPLGVLFAEVKPGEHSRLSPGQTSWAYMLRANWVRHTVWTAEALAGGQVRVDLDALILKPAASV